ncbi:MAG: Gfo/Idh/MocA family oxidoreductase [Planctomycetes bacterium]|nr:Gfo/Idh/MocA family oxidoreductase [Planctomycetota bacterium]
MSKETVKKTCGGRPRRTSVKSESACRLRAVSVGCGGRAQAHIKAMLESGVVDLLAVCDLDEARLKATAERFQIAKTYRDLGEMIQKEKPELVDIVTPPTIRTSIVEPAVRAGAPAILIEKPIALKPSETRKLVELGRDRLIAVNTQYQWKPHWKRFWPILEKGGLGEVRVIRASTLANILEQAPHTLDLAMKAARLSGLPEPQWCLAGASGLEHFGQIPVPADVTATFGMGEVRLQINHGPSAPPVPGETVKWYHIQVDVLGSRGRLWVSLNQGWALWRSGKFESGKTEWGKNDGEAQSALYVHLRDTLHGGNIREFPTRVEIAARNSDLMMACYASALGGGRVQLPIPLSDDVVDRLKGLGSSTASA